MYQALILIDNNEAAHRELLDAQCPAGLQLHYIDTPEQIPTVLLTQCEIALGSPGWLAQVVSRMPQLKWAQSSYAGVEKLCNPTLPTHYRLTNTRGLFGPLMSEYVFGHILAIERQLYANHQCQQDKVWNWKILPYRSLQNLHMGIVGLGSIGKHVAGTAKHFGMQVSGLKRHPEMISSVDHVFSLEQKQAFLQQALDYLVLALPATPASTHFLDQEALHLLSPQTRIINVGRGNAIDETALIEVLQQQRIAGAVLDVFEQEPLAPESPLWHMPNVHITPHNAADSFPEQVVDIFFSNFQRYQHGETLMNLIDFQQGY